MRICVYVYVGVHVCVGVLGWVLSVYLCLYVYVWLYVTAFQIRLVRSRPVRGDSDLYPFWTRYHGDSKTDPWDDP